LYRDFLVMPEVDLVCPECDRRRKMPRGNFNQLIGSVPGRQGFRQRADGSYEVLCRPCSAKRSAHRNFGETSREDAIALLGTRPERAATLRRAHAKSHRKGKTLTPKSRAAISLGKIGLGKLDRPFYLCPL